MASARPPFHASARWIWRSPEPVTVNEYVCFRRLFRLREATRGRLRIAADSDYALFVNGVEVYGRQFSDYPRERSYNEHDVRPLLRKGENVLAVLAWYRGVDTNEHRAGRPGLLLELDAGRTRIVSDGAWRCRRSPSFVSGPLPAVTPQLGITVRYDARREDGWTARRYDDAEWGKAVELAGPTDGYWTRLRPRPLPGCTLAPLVNGAPLCRGTTVRPGPGEEIALEHSRFSDERAHETRDAEELGPARSVASSWRRVEQTPLPPLPLTLPPPDRAGGGAFLLLDLGREEVGLLHLALEAPAGTVVEIAHGEHIEAGLGVRAFLDGREFVDQYVCSEGRNVFTLPFRRLGARYLELHISGHGRPVRVEAAGLLPTVYPVEERGGFESPDAMHRPLWDVSVRTLRLCMHEHYEDCPWREQALYAFDSRNQALYGYSAFGEYDFPEESFRLLGKGQREDGLLELCAPARVPITIPAFSLVWVTALREHQLYSGRSTLFREFQPAIERLLAAFLRLHDAKTGLYGLFAGDAYWTFYEWAAGMDFKNGYSFGDDGVFRLDAPHNLFLLEAMESYADLLRWNGRPAEAEAWLRRGRRLRRSIQSVFYDSGAKRYYSFANHETRWHLSALPQAMALKLGVAPRAAATSLRWALLEDEALEPMSLSTLWYGTEAMTEGPAAFQEAYTKKILDTYGRMLLRGATCLWETAAGSRDFDGAGSLCHAWSAVPVWVFHAILMGIRPLAPGFREFLCEPHPVAVATARGVVPTPEGPIIVSWENTRECFRLRLKSPKGLTPRVSLPPRLARKSDVRVNNRRHVLD